MSDAELPGGGRSGILQRACEHVGALEPVEGAIEGTVRGQAASFGLVTDFAGHGVPVEGLLAAPQQVHASREDGKLDWEQGAGLASHGAIIRR